MLARRTSSLGPPFSSNSSSGRYERSHVSRMSRWSWLPLTPDSGTWCERHVPSVFWPSTSFGPVQPLGERRMISGQSGRVPSQSPPRADSLDLADPDPGAGQRRGEPMVHPRDVVALDLDDLVAVAGEELAHLGRVLAAQHGRAGDLRAVEVQDREHGPVAGRVEERDALPRALERARLRLAVADDGEGDEVGVVHDRAEGVHEDVAELAALVDRAGGRHRDVARDPTGSGELAAEPQQPVLVLGDLGVDLAVGALEVAGSDERRTAVAGAGEVDHLLVRLADQPRRVGVDERQAGARAPVAEQTRLDVVRDERALEQRVRTQVDLGDGEVVVGPPPGVEGCELVIGRVRERLDERVGGDCGGACGHGVPPGRARRLQSGRTRRKRLQDQR